ncbi:TetR family transcriptional regulator [Sneathiella sp. P13V-1]|uniref:TetR/AcrR family transcriptional regulator n=1 Tax=Sneathiella sp. P13V-1 TaxID=2697366 RepID=UPI00187B9E7A|nr:TetR/AcrR family transcriptional regulator [Sneathiella sp. P13V-1]MBE7635296.1 TetR family transcriptional regulator [Sneathiella sp. P13V-1]
MGRRPKSDRQFEELRAKIILCALSLFQEEGYAAISMRRLAKEVGCAPMTIYAHFDGKIDILQHLWADILGELFDHIRHKLTPDLDDEERLSLASKIFVQFWIDHPDHFRLVFMSAEITRADVGSFLNKSNTLTHFHFYTELVEPVCVNKARVKLVTDTLLNMLIGIAFCANTIKDYPWSTAENMVDVVLESALNKN